MSNVTEPDGPIAVLDDAGDYRYVIAGGSHNWLPSTDGPWCVYMSETALRLRRLPVAGPWESVLPLPSWWTGSRTWVTCDQEYVYVRTPRQSVKALIEPALRGEAEWTRTRFPEQPACGPKMLTFGDRVRAAWHMLRHGRAYIG